MFLSLRKASLSMTFFLAAGVALAHAENMPSQASRPLHEVNGFRRVHFGMDEAQVRAAIARDFKDQAALVQQVDHPAKRVRMLVLPLPALEPGPGPAGVTYIFGATTNKLIQVNVLWTTSPRPDEAERTRLTSAGVQLSDYFRALKWRPNAATMGLPLGPNGLVLFSGIDPKNAMVEVSLSGIAIRGKDGVAAPPAGPAKLRVAYLSTAGKPDVTLAPGN